MAKSREVSERAQPSHLRAVARFLLHRAAVRFRRAPDGKCAPELTLAKLSASPRSVARYLRATGGETFPPAPGAPYPPLYSAVWETACYLDLIRLAGFPIPPGGIVHLGEERIWLRPLRADRPAELRMKLARVEKVRGGTRLTLAVHLAAGGHRCVEADTQLLLRGVSGGRGPRSARLAPAHGPWLDAGSWRVGPEHGRRYARVSGDFNPIHLGRLGARLFGFERAILHGYCIEAMVVHRLAAQHLGGDAGSLRRLAIRFTAPLPLPSSVSLRTRLPRAGVPGAFQLVRAGAEGRPYAVGEWVASVPAAQG